jgi:DNA invertase Pin-like site-specific DNA recombinase
MVRDVKKDGSIHKILCSDINRLGKTKDWILQLFVELYRANISVVSANDDIDTGRSEKDVFNFLTTLCTKDNQRQQYIANFRGKRRKKAKKPLKKDSTKKMKGGK